MSRGTFYNHIFRNKRDNTWYAKHREILREEIKRVYEESNQVFGAGKITAVLKEHGYNTSLETFRRLMSDVGLVSIRQRAKALYEQEKRRAPKNILNQRFTVNKPNSVWVSDVTCYKFGEKMFYLCAIVDLYARKVVGCRVGFNNRTQLIKRTFREVHEDRKPERFFSSRKREELYRRKYRSEREVYQAIADCITFYNDKRPHISNGYKTRRSRSIILSLMIFRDDFRWLEVFCRAFRVPPEYNRAQRVYRRASRS